MKDSSLTKIAHRMNRSEYIFKTIDSMKVQELRQLLKSENPALKLYMDYIALKLEEKLILEKYLRVG